MLKDPNITVLRSRLTAYNTPLARELVNSLDGYTKVERGVTLGLIDELLTFWEEHHAASKAAP